MRTGTWAAAALLALSLAACGKKSETASSGSPSGNAVERQAAADASNVTSIPGYTPNTGAAGNAAAGAAHR